MSTAHIAATKPGLWVSSGDTAHWMPTGCYAAVPAKEPPQPFVDHGTAQFLVVIGFLALVLPIVISALMLLDAWIKGYIGWRGDE